MNPSSDWKELTFRDIAKQKSIRVNNPKESKYERYVGLEHLDSGELVVKRWGNTKDVSSSMLQFNKNDILFARRNTYLRRVSVALFDGICSGDIIVIEPILTHIIQGFLPIYMQFKEFEDQVIAWSAGAFSKRIKWNQLANFEIWIPSKEEQHKMVNVIWTIQDNIDKTEALIRATEKLRKELLEELLRKKLGNTEFKNVNFNLENLSIPKTWDCLTIQELIDNEWIYPNQDGNHGELHPKGSDFIDEGIPFITANDISDFKIDFDHAKKISEQVADKLRIPAAMKDDILITHKGTLARVAIIPQTRYNRIVLSPQVTYYRVRNHDRITRDFLFYFFQTELFQRMFRAFGKQSTRDFISITRQRKLKIIIPSSIDDQIRITRIL